MLTDATHAPALRSWVASANLPGCDFPIQNLPLGRFRPPTAEGAETEPPRVGVAIGDQVLDLKLAAAQCPWPDEIYPLLEPLTAGDLANFMAMGRPAWQLLRAALSVALAEDSDQGPFLELCLHPQADLTMLLPCVVRDYTDFYIGIHHATAIGKMLRPDSPLLPNYKWLPIGYHGRASSVGLGGPLRRPLGQIRLAADAPPVYAPTRRLDYEMELGLWVGVGNKAGEPVAIDIAEDQLFGVTLLNDWSARDIQSWEYQPLGPFLSKSFATSVSPWVVSFDALAPFRRPLQRPAGDPAPLDYLDSPANRAHGSFGITLEVWLQTARMRAARLPAVRLSHADMAEAAYWTPAQLLAHHTSNGCPLATGDLFGTGTLSGPGAGQGGSLMELSRGGREPLLLPGGEQRCFLENGDTVALRAYCEAPGAVRIGLGAVAGTVMAA
ncbi:MAG: fumarylacetoacetase [Betaproteobacteria bacterium]|nr:fumarylacetoacetase [Betaproteobacteria bacterium]